jgi:Putative restriction endonuclease
MIGSESTHGVARLFPGWPAQHQRPYPSDSAPAKCYHTFMVALRKHIPARMTLTEFLSWDPADPSGQAWQLIDGEPVAMAPGSETHAALQGEIGALLRNHLLDRDGPCRLLSQPGIVPRVRANRNFRIPDLAVTCVPPALGLMVADPILLIEILSPSNERARNPRSPQHAHRGGTAAPRCRWNLAGGTRNPCRVGHLDARQHRLRHSAHYALPDHRPGLSAIPTQSRPPNRLAVARQTKPDTSRSTKT